MDTDKESNEIRIVRFEGKLDTIAYKLDQLISDVDKNYVTRSEFTPVRNVTYYIVGALGTVTVSIIVAVMVYLVQN